MSAVQAMIESTPFPDIGDTCPACGGNGVWETECCSGYGGCSCMGQRVYMGQCNACSGAGVVTEDYQKGANIVALAGSCYVGTGPGGMC